MKNDGQASRALRISAAAQKLHVTRAAHGLVYARFGKHVVASDANPRPFDIPGMVLDPSLAEKNRDWSPKILLPQVLDEIAKHAEQNPNPLEISIS